MTISPTFNHGKPAWRVNYSVPLETPVDGKRTKQMRKFFPRDPSKRKQCPGYADAEKFVAGLTKKVFSEGPTIAAMSSAERVAMLGHWMKLKEFKLDPNAVIVAAMTKKAESPLVSKVAEECVNAKKAAGKRDAYTKQLKSVLKQFHSTFPSCTISEMEPSQIETWIQSGDYAPASRRSRLADIYTLFSFAVRRGYCNNNPCDRVERISVTPKMPGIFRPRAAAKLMRVAFNRDRELCPHLALGLFCGLRPIEVERITKAQIHVDRRLVEVTYEMSKTTKRRVVDIPENAAEWMAIKTTYPLKNWKRRFDRIRRQAGLFETWPHDVLRHSAATFASALTGDVARVCKQMGHSEAIFKTHYHATRVNGELVTKKMAEDFFDIRPPCLVRIVRLAEAN